MAPAPLTHLGAIPVAQFMRRCWQRKPLLIRNALADFVAPVDAASLFRLAGREEVEARLVTTFDGWRVIHGPLARRRIPPLAKPGWTLLVQGVDQLDERAADLLARFRFISDARLDDLMISYASDAGGVGPHVDDYDVFLLQAQGRRRWRIGSGDARDFVPDLPLKVLRRFKVEQDWVLDPGDMLYLPPGVAHEGTAIGGGCLTCSIGFRSPEWRELLEPWLDTLASRQTNAGRYVDRGTAPVRQPARLPKQFVAAAVRALRHGPPTRADASRLLLTFLTEPKANIVFVRPRRVLSPHDLRDRARRRGLRLDRRTRMLYSDGSMAINGELLHYATQDLSVMHALADKRALDPAQLMKLAASTWRTLADWHGAGWLHVT